MVVRVPFGTNNRISRKLSVPLSHKNSYPRLLSTSPGRRLSFPRTSALGVGDRNERLHIINEEPVLGLGADSDKVVLEQRHERTVQRHSGLSRNVKLDAADSAPNKLGPVTGETNGVVTEDAVTEVSGTPNDAARRDNRSSVLQPGSRPQETV